MAHIYAADANVNIRIDIHIFSLHWISSVSEKAFGLHRHLKQNVFHHQVPAINLNVNLKPFVFGKPLNGYFD